MDLFQNYKTGKFTSKNVRTVNNIAISLMVLIALSSIVWSISIYIMPIDLHNAFVDGKLSFRPRDFTYMSSQQKELLHRDLEVLINRKYTVQKGVIENEANQIKTEKHTMTKEEMSAFTANSSTKRPKVRKINHVIQTIADVRRAEEEAKLEKPDKDNNDTYVEIIKFNATKDRLFLEKMTFNVVSTQSSSMMSMIEGVPFLSEIVAIGWTAMFLIFQSGSKDYSLLPKPWRIVLPSIVMCTIMTLICIIYFFLSHNELKHFCQQLRGNLTDPNAISCGEALTVLRPLISVYNYKPDVSLNLFRGFLLLTVALWCFALTVMLLRYFFAIDFQRADYHKDSPDGQAMKFPKMPEYTEVPLDAPNPIAISLEVHEENHCSEDEFSSAKTHLSEVAKPLL